MKNRQPKHTKRFRRDYAKLKRSGKNMRKLHVVMEILMDGATLPPKYRDHSLHGPWRHLRDCHVEGDWILLYELGEDQQGNEWILFHATDNHEHLFG